jgi:hypothetical protein
VIVERFYWIVLGSKGRAFEWTVSWQRKTAVRKAVEGLPRDWKHYRTKQGWRVIKVALVEYIE